MKKYVLLFLVIISTFSYAMKDLKNMKTLKFNAEEKQVINGKVKIIKYEIIIEFPDKIKKEITYPELNKGEIYVYDKEMKKIYLPIFDEYKEEKIDRDENKIIQTINRIRDLEEDSLMKKEYQAKKLKILHIDDDKNIEVRIKKYFEKDDYVLPKEIEIKDRDIKLGEVSINDIVVDPIIDSKIFEIKQGEK